MIRLVFSASMFLRNSLKHGTYLRAFPFFLLMLCGCHRISFQAEQAQAQRIAKELTGEDIIYEEEGCASVAPVLPQELSRDEAVRIALLANKDLRASLYELGIAKTNLADAVLFQNPLISFAKPFPLNTSQRPSTADYIQIDTQILNVPDIIQIPLRRRMYSAQLEIAVYTFVNKMIDIIAQTRQAYDKVLLSRALIENIDNSVRINEEAEAVKSGTKDSQRIAHKKHVKTVTALTYEISKLSYMKELVTALADLRVLLGVDQDYFSLVKLSSSLTDQMTPLPGLGALVQWAENSHVDMMIGQKKIEYAVELLAYEKSKVIDRTSIGTTYFKDLVAKDAGVGPYLIAAVPLFHQNQPRIVQADYIVEKSRRELDDKRNRLKAALSVAHEKITLQMQIVDRYEKELLIVHTELIDHLKKFKKEIRANGLYVWKKRLEFNELKAKSLEAHYQLLELYTNLEKVCGKRLFFAQRTIMPGSQGNDC